MSKDTPTPSKPIKQTHNEPILLPLILILLNYGLLATILLKGPILELFTPVAVLIVYAPMFFYTLFILKDVTLSRQRPLYSLVSCSIALYPFLYFIIPFVLWGYHRLLG